jgi:hypothetical protein
MKRIHFYIWITIILLAISCSPEPDNRLGEYFINNKSNQKVDFKQFLDGEILRQYILNTGEQAKYQNECEGCIPSPPPFWGDSVVISFNDTINMVHYRIEGQDSIRNFFYRESWVGGEVEGYRYVFDYNITDEDYENAFNSQMK